MPGSREIHRINGQRPRVSVPLAGRSATGWDVTRSFNDTSPWAQVAFQSSNTMTGSCELSHKGCAQRVIMINNIDYNQCVNNRCRAVQQWRVVYYRIVQRADRDYCNNIIIAIIVFK